MTQVRLCIRKIYNVVYFKCTDPEYSPKYTVSYNKVETICTVTTPITSLVETVIFMQLQPIYVDPLSSVRVKVFPQTGIEVMQWI